MHMSIWPSSLKLEYQDVTTCQPGLSQKPHTVLTINTPDGDIIDIFLPFEYRIKPADVRETIR